MAKVNLRLVAHVTAADPTSSRTEKRTALEQIAVRCKSKSPVITKSKEMSAFRIRTGV